MKLRAIGMAISLSAAVIVVPAAAQAAARPTIKAKNVMAAESAGSAKVRVVLSAPVGRAVKVDYSTSPGGPGMPATASEDYTAVSGTLTIPAGRVRGTVSVPIVQDALDEDDETFAVNFANPRGGKLLTPETVVIIFDDDALPTISVGDVSVAENVPSPFGPVRGGLTVTGYAQVPLTLSAVSGRSVEVTVVPTDGTATGGSDYSNGSIITFITPGQATGYTYIPIYDDATVEADETFTVDLTLPINATIGDGNATVTITNDDTVGGGGGGGGCAPITGARLIIC